MVKVTNLQQELQEAKSEYDRSKLALTYAHCKISVHLKYQKSSSLSRVNNRKERIKLSSPKASGSYSVMFSKYVLNKVINTSTSSNHLKYKPFLS